MERARNADVKEPGTAIAVKVVDREDAEDGADELATVAALAAAVINQDTVAGRVLDRVVTVLANLPEALSPATGLLALSIRNGLRILDAMPRLRRTRQGAQPHGSDEPRAPRAVERIAIGRGR
ncbi:MAG: hypothetical protein HY816_12340 [Candidatus Wallbacteria bacterium]|nr:hypothetical protein [Candidatus Wallbacteria bacterium]